MNSFLRNLRFSNRLDSGRASSSGEPADAVMAAVDRRLRDQCTPAPEAPPWLHASIMNALREEAPTRVRSARHLRSAAVATFITVVLAVVGFLAVRQAAPSGESAPLVVGHVEADQAIRQLATESTVLLLSPLESELACLSRDLDRTRTFLLASLP